MHRAVGVYWNSVSVWGVFVIALLIVGVFHTPMVWASERLVISTELVPEYHIWEQTLVDAFAEETPEISAGDIEIRWGQSTDAVIASTAAGNPPDVLVHDHTRIDQFRRAGLVTPLPSRLDPLFEPFFPPAVEGTEYQGRRYGAPVWFNVWVPIYNVNMFNEVGIGSAPAGWTWDQWLDASRRLTRDTDGDGTPDIWADVSGLSPRRWALHRIFTNGGWLYDRDEQQWGGMLDETIEALEEVAQWFNVYRIIPRPGELTGSDRENFQGGGSAMRQGPNGELSLMRRLTSFEWDIADNPKDPQTGRNTTTYTYGLTSIHADAANPELAEKFVAFMLSDRAQRILIEADRFVAHREMALELVMDNTTPQDEGAIIRAAQDMRVWDYYLLPGDSTAVINRAISGVMGGELSGRSAMEEITPTILGNLAELNQ